MRKTRFLKSTFVAALTAFTGLSTFAPNAGAVEFNNTEANGVEYIMIEGAFESARSSNPFSWNMLVDDTSLSHSFYRLLKKQRPIVITLNSEGGARETALTMARTINFLAGVYYEKYKTRLVLGIAGECPSACSFFTAELTKGRNAKHLMIVTTADTPFLIHGPRDFETGEPLSRDDFDSELSAGMEQYIGSGVSRAWLKKHRQLFRRDRDGQTFRASQMCGNGSNILPKDACVDSYAEIERRISRSSQKGSFGASKWRKK